MRISVNKLNLLEKGPQTTTSNRGEILRLAKSELRSMLILAKPESNSAKLSRPRRER
jgi:hypothetical protein